MSLVSFNEIESQKRKFFLGGEAASRGFGLTHMDAPQEYEVGQCSLCAHSKPYRLDSSYTECVTRARVHDKKGKKITWVRIIFIEHVARTELIFAEILRQGWSSVVVSLVTHLPPPLRSGKDMTGTKART